MDCIFIEHHLYQVLVQLHIRKNSDNVFNKLEFTSLSYKECTVHVQSRAIFIILGGIKGLLSSCFLSLYYHFCLYTLPKQQEIHPLYTPSRKNVKRQMSTCWPSQSFSEASPRTFHLHFIYQSVSPCPHISSIGKGAGDIKVFSGSACCPSQQNCCSHFNSVQSLSCVRLFSIPWTAECQASLFVTNSQNLLKLMSTELVMASNQLILCHPLLLLPSIFPSIRVFSNESVLHIRCPK